MRSSGVLLLSTLVVGSLSRPQQDQHNYEMDLQGGRELMDIENVSSTVRNSPLTSNIYIHQPFKKSGRYDD